MRTIKAKALRRGDVVGICAPASPLKTKVSVDRGIRYLERLGYRVELGKHLYRRHGYLAGSDGQRAADINQLFANPDVKAIFTLRGGFGTHRILPLLDYRLIRNNPKILVGYSDITALQLAVLSRAGLVSFTGPMVGVEMAHGLRGKTEEQFWQCLTSDKPPQSIKTPADRPVRKPGVATGRLIGGNFSLVAASIGTPYFPAEKDMVLLLEEIDERPYRIDRMLQQVKLAGVMNRLRGLVLGAFTNCIPEKGKPSLTLRQVFGEALREYSFPAVSGLRYGHVERSLTLPIGARVQLDGTRGLLRFLEAGVA